MVLVKLCAILTRVLDEFLQVGIDEFHHNKEVREFRLRVALVSREDHIENLRREIISWDTRQLSHDLDLTEHFLSSVKMLKRLLHQLDGDTFIGLNVACFHHLAEAACS